MACQGPSMAMHTNHRTMTTAWSSIALASHRLGPTWASAAPLHMGQDREDYRFGMDAVTKWTWSELHTDQSGWRHESNGKCWTFEGDLAPKRLRGWQSAAPPQMGLHKTGPCDSFSLDSWGWSQDESRPPLRDSKVCY